MKRFRGILPLPGSWGKPLPAPGEIDRELTMTQFQEPSPDEVNETIAGF
jgi:hypothetical protein